VGYTLLRRTSQAENTLSFSRFLPIWLWKNLWKNLELSELSTKATKALKSDEKLSAKNKFHQKISSCADASALNF
jgi:hypothetical protein